MRKMEKNFALAQSTCAQHPPRPAADDATALPDRKVNADKFHDLTNAAEINTATCNSRSWRSSKRVLWDDGSDYDYDCACPVPCAPLPARRFPAFSFDNVNVNVINKTGSRFLRVRPLKSLTFKCAFLLCTSPGGATGYTFATFKLCLGAAAAAAAAEVSVQEFVELRQFFAVSSTLALKLALSLSLCVCLCVCEFAFVALLCFG